MVSEYEARDAARIRELADRVASARRAKIDYIVAVYRLHPTADSLFDARSIAKEIYVSYLTGVITEADVELFSRYVSDPLVVYLLRCFQASNLLIARVQSSETPV